MKKSFIFLIVLLMPFQFEVFAQFEIHESIYEKTFWIDDKDNTETNYIFYLSPSKHPKSVEKINQTLFGKIFNSSFDMMSFDDSLFLDEYYNRLDHSYRYEILENSVKYLSIHVSYYIGSDTVRTEKYYTFITASGELIQLWDLFEPGGYARFEELVFEDFNDELKNYMHSLDTSTIKMKDKYEILMECLDEKFYAKYHFEDGYFYLSSTGFFVVSPPCYHHFTQPNNIPWLQNDYAYKEIEKFLTNRIVNYSTTGEWDFTLHELLQLSPACYGTINGYEEEFRIIKKDGLIKGEIYLSYLETYYPFKLFIYKNEVFIQSLNNEVKTSMMTINKGIISGTFQYSENESFEISFELPAGE